MQYGYKKNTYWEESVNKRFLATINVGLLAKFYNLPLFVWGITTINTLDDKKRFSTTITTSGSSLA